MKYMGWNRMNPVIMHINYCECSYYHLAMSIDEVCRKAKEWGFDGIEFRGALPKGFTGSMDAYLKEIRDAKARYGLTDILYGYGVSGISSDDAATRAKAIDDAIAFFHKAKEQTGTTICNVFADDIVNPQGGGNFNFSGSHYATEDQWKYTAEGFHAIGEACEKMGMKLAFETHMNYIHDVPKAVRKLLDMIDSPAVGANMDYGNTVYFLNVPTPEETIALYGDKLFHMHLKNSIGMAGSRYPTALSEGEINHRPYLKALAASGYQGPIGIEAPRGGDREWFVRQDIAYFKTVAAEVGLK